MKLPRAILWTSILAFLATSVSFAATKTHNGTGSLSGGTNWSPSGTPTTSDEALITGTPNAAITTAVGTNLTFGNFIFNSNVASTIGPNSGSATNTTWNLTGGGGSTAAIANGGASGDLLVLGTNATSNTVTIIDNAGAGTGKMKLSLNAAGNIDVVNGGATLSLSLVVDGTNGLTKTGAGALILEKANTYTGTTTLNAGTLGLASNSALNGTALTINGGALAASGAPRTFTSSMTIGGNFTLGGLGNTLTNNGTTNLGGATRSITVANSATLGGIVSNGGITLESSNATRSLTLSAANTFTGNATVNGGILALSGAGALDDSVAVNVAGGTATFDISAITASSETIGSLASASGASVLLGAKNLTFGGSNASTISAGNISGAGSVTKTGSGTQTFSAANGYSGTTTISGGALRISHNTALGTGAGITDIVGGAVAGKLELTAGINSAENITIRGKSTGSGLDHVTNVSGNNELSGTITYESGGTRYGLSSTADKLTISGNITPGAGLTGNKTIFLTGAGNGAVTGSITQTGADPGMVAGVTKEGAGTWTLSSSSNAYTGATTVSGGTLEVTANNALGTNAAGTSVASGATLKLNNVNYSTAEALSINGGSALLNAGTSTFAGQVTAATNATINAGGGTLNLTGGLVKDGTTLTLAGGGRINISTNGISGASANSDLVIDGTTVVTSVASTYNGPTTVQNGGVLVANNTTGSATGTGNVTVDSTSTLSGTGRVDAGTNKSITLSGVLEVGDSTLVSPVASKLTLATGGTGLTTLTAPSTLKIELFTGAGLGDNSSILTAADILAVGGDLSIAPGATLQVSSSMSGWAIGDRWRIFDWSNVNTISGNFSYVLPTLGAGLVWDTSDIFTTTGLLSGTIDIEVVPEPGTALFGLACIATAALRRRRHVRAVRR